MSPVDAPSTTLCGPCRLECCWNCNRYPDSTAVEEFECACSNHCPVCGKAYQSVGGPQGPMFCSGAPAHLAELVVSVDLVLVVGRLVITDAASEAPGSDIDLKAAVQRDDLSPSIRALAAALVQLDHMREVRDNPPDPH